MTDIVKIFEEHKNVVYRLALSYTGSVAEAEDICQNAFVRLLENRQKVPDEKAKSWLMTVTANLCRDYLKSFWVRNTEPLDERLSFQTPEQGEVFHAMMALTPKERVVVYLHYYEGYTTREIGKLLGVSQTAVSTRLNRARKHMKVQLEEELG